MQKLIFQTRAWIEYQLKAKGRHGIHSPFVYGLYDKAILPGPDQDKSKLHAIEGLRKKLLQDHRILEVEDFGAGLGGVEIPRIQRKVSEIAASSARGPKYGGLLSRLMQYLQPGQTLEMGTNLGLSSLYLLNGHPNSRLVTLEGSQAIAEIASENLNQSGLHPEIHIGEFSETLHNLNWESFKPDFLFIDGNHRKDPTVTYFKFLIAKASPQAVFVFDDIHWSPGMQAAWDIIRADERVQVSIDLFGMGLCFTGRNQAKEHFILSF